MRTSAYRFVALAAAISGLTAGPVFGESPQGDYGAEEKLIRQTAEVFEQAFGRGDAKALAGLWTEKGEYVDEAGAVTSGRAAIEKAFAEFFAERPKARMKSVIDSIRFLGPTIAVEEGTSRLNEPSIGDVSVARYTVTHVKEDGKWLMASVRDHESERLSNHEKLRGLEPLIGDWTARGEKGRVETSCEWIENRNFIHRKFTTYQGDVVVGSGFEIIGVDPGMDQIASWHFAHDGGVGHSVWCKDGDGWIIEARGTTPDGLSTVATNVLTPVDADTFTWSSFGREVEGQPMQDTPIAKIVRNQKTKSGA